jgi:hypothetical protein
MLLTFSKDETTSNDGRCRHLKPRPSISKPRLVTGTQRAVHKVYYDKWDEQFYIFIYHKTISSIVLCTM